MRISSQSRHSERTVRTNRSAIAFAFGARTGVFTVADQEAYALLREVKAEVARLLGDPLTGRIPGAASDPDAAAGVGDEEEHVEAAEQDRLDGEEVAGDDGGRLRPQELAPARPATTRRRLENRRPPAAARCSSRRRRNRACTARRRSDGAPSAGSRAQAGAPAPESRAAAAAAPLGPEVAATFAAPVPGATAATSAASPATPTAAAAAGEQRRRPVGPGQPRGASDAQPDGAVRAW